jgi:uncharacterized protein (DUF2267 family)
MSEVSVLDRTVQKTHQWLHDVEKELSWRDERRAYTALRAVLNSLRDRLTLEEVAQFGAQLPMFLRGVYYQRWDPTHTPIRKRDSETFLGEVRAAFERTNEPHVDAEKIARGVFKVIAKHISPGETEHVRKMLPRGVREFWPNESCGSL